jgi:ribonuclease HII
MACNLAHEEGLRARGLFLIAGIDEAGRGPLAGPVVAAAVILPDGFTHAMLDDSKKLTEKKRELLYSEITSNKAIRWAFSALDAGEIDRINILRATHEAMRQAARQLEPEHVLIDGLSVREFPYPQTALVGGDALSFSIAAASIIAKVTRDRFMLEMDAQYPEYGFAKHKGYGTRQHLEALKTHGPCPIHRRTFLPVQQAELGL